MSFSVGKRKEVQRGNMRSREFAPEYWRPGGRAPGGQSRVTGVSTGTCRCEHSICSISEGEQNCVKIKSPGLGVSIGQEHVNGSL